MHKATLLIALMLLLPASQAVSTDLPEDLEQYAASQNVPRQADEAVVSGPTVSGSAPGAPFDDVGAPAAPGSDGDGASTVQARPADGQGAPVQLPDTPKTRLLARIGHEDVTAADIAMAVRDYAAPPPTSLSQFDENSTTLYTYSVGDIDGDGYGDLALDTWCTGYTGCPDTYDRFEVSGVRSSLGAACSEPHAVQVISGKDGHQIWNGTLDTPHELPGYFSLGCSLHFVAGTVPLDDGTRGMLIYRYDVAQVFGERFEIRNTLYLMEPRTGSTVWSYQVDGHYYTGYFLSNGHINSRNLLLLPILDVEPAEGPYWAPNGSQEALTVVSVGFNITGVNPFFSAPTMDGPIVLVNDYQPDEWAAMLDPRTGDVAWRESTFQEDRSRSVFPQAFWGTSLAGGYPPADSFYANNAVPRQHSHYWGFEPCCHDLDGDGTPDFVYTTLEWANTPNPNTEGPYGLDSRLVAFTGSDGSRLYETWLTRDNEAFVLTMSAQALGDLDGDGKADFMLRQETLNPDPVHIYSVRNGSTGEEMWHIRNIRLMETMPVGDVDGDGGNDIFLMEWFEYEFPFSISTPFVNVTHTPLKVFHGATGDLLWRDESFIAASDLYQLMENAFVNGFPDLDGDGVMDIPAADPIYLPDGTVIHQTRFLSPVTGETLTEIVTAGAFAIPLRSADITGDGVDDLTIVNGDVLDLWITAYDGKSGKAEWSRRVSDLRISSSSSALPVIRTHNIQTPDGPVSDVVVNFQMSYMSTGGYYIQLYTTQQIAGLRGTNGTLVWAMPQIYDKDAIGAVEGASPASALFGELIRPKTLGEKLSLWKPSAVGGLGTFGAAAVLAFLIARRWPA